MDPTPEPSPCRGLSPSGPDCPTPTPATTPAVDPGVGQPDGDAGSGVADALPIVLDLLPWVLAVVLLAVVVALLADRTRRLALGSARAPGVVRSPAYATQRTHVLPPTRPGNAAPHGGAPPSDVLPPALVDDLLTLADLGTTPAVASQVRRVLRSLGVEPIEPAVGAPLDMDQHEVVATAPVQDPVQHERVARTHRPGWRRGPEVLRPAAVELWVLAPAPPTRPAPSA